MVVKITRQSGLRTEAIPAVATPSEPVDVFQKGVDDIVERFRSEPVTPQRFLELENALHAAAAEACRQLIEREANRLEADDKQVVPSKMRYHKETYRLNKKTPARIATRFGTITVRSFYYLNEEDGEPGLHPLLLRLGIGAGTATPALLERVARLSVEQTQTETRAWLRREHGLVWSNDRLRAALAGFRQALLPFVADLQKTRLLAWLTQAEQSRGRNRPVLAVGRDGIMVPMRQGGYKEASTATVSVYDRGRRRLGTIYLGQMPEEKQATLTRALTALVTATLLAWQRPVPRLAYITDKGSAPDDYYRRRAEQDEASACWHAVDLGMGARFLSRMHLPLQDGRRLVRRRDGSRNAVVREDAALAAGSTPGSGPGAALRDAALGSPPRHQGAAGRVLESVSLCASSSPLDGLSGL